MKQFLFVIFSIAYFHTISINVGAQSPIYRQLKNEWAEFEKGDDHQKNYMLGSLLKDIEEGMHDLQEGKLLNRFLPGWQLACPADSTFSVFYCMVPGESQPARLLYGYLHPQRDEVFVFSHLLKKSTYSDLLLAEIVANGDDDLGYSLSFKAGDEMLLEIPDVSIGVLLERLFRAREDMKKKEIADSLVIGVKRLMRQSKWFGSLFKGYDKLSTVVSSDGMLKLMTWNVETGMGNHFFYGVAGIKQKKGITVVPLEDKRELIASPEFAALSPSKWYGAIYYSIVVKRYKGKTLYTLLGYNGHDAFSKLRVVDVVALSADGMLHFGLPIFDQGGRKKRRILFEYSNQASMMLRYDERSKMIVMDHLAPIEPIYQGNRNYYGPDMSVDALVFKKGRWILNEDVDFRNR